MSSECLGYSLHVSPLPGWLAYLPCRRMGAGSVTANGDDSAFHITCNFLASGDEAVLMAN